MIKTFPVLAAQRTKGCPASISWDKLNEEWAMKNHSQTLTRLAERGGLSPCEMVANINRVYYWDLTAQQKSDAVSTINLLIPVEE